MLKDSDVRYSFNAGEWSPLLNGRMDLERYSASCRTLRNALVFNEGPMARRPGFKYLGSSYENTRGRLIPFIFSQAEAYLLEFTASGSTLKLRFWKNDALVLSSSVPYTLDTVFSITDLPDVRFKQIQDVMWMVHPDHKPRLLKRYGDDDWEFEEIDFLDGPYGEENVDESLEIESTGFEAGASVTLTSDEDVFSADDVGKAIYFRENSGALNYEEWAAEESVTAGDIRVNAGYSYKAEGSGTTGSIPPTWTPTPYPSSANGPFSDGSVEWTVLNDGRGWALITAFTSAQEVTATVNVALPPPMADSEPSYRWAKSSWGEDLGYPRGVHFFDDRIVYLKDNYLDMSKVGEYDVFAKGTLPDDAVQLKMTDNNYVEPVWLSVNRNISVGSLEGIYVLTQDPTEQTITPENLPKSRRLSNKKSSELEPVYGETATLYAGKGRKSLFALDYSIEVDGLKTNNMTIFANHILRPKVKEMAWQERPQGTLWCLLEDGTLATMLYEFSQEVIAWSRHDTDGEIISIAVLPNPDVGDDREVLYAMIARTVGGEEKVFIERLSDLFFPSELNATNSLFYDSSVIYSGEETLVVDGLDHLEGEMVGIWTNLGQEPDLQEVVDGEVSVPLGTTYAVVGLPYTTEFVSPRIRSSVSESSSMYAKKTTSSVYMEFVRTGECYVGPALDALSKVKHFDIAAAEIYDEGQEGLFPLFTGVSKAQISSRTVRDLAFAVSSGANSGSPINLLHYAVQFGASPPI